MSAFRILWLEEDYLEAFEAALQSKGFSVTRAFFISDAVKQLEESRFDLLLLDVMIPIEDQDIRLGFTKSTTAGGDRSGIAFYQKYRDKLNSEGIQVLVYTILGDNDETKQAFVDLGLKPENYIDKVSSSNVNDLIQHVEKALRRSTPVTHRKD